MIKYGKDKKKKTTEKIDECNDFKCATCDKFNSCKERYMHSLCIKYEDIEPRAKDIIKLIDTITKDIEPIHYNCIPGYETSIYIDEYVYEDSKIIVTKHKGLIKEIEPIENYTKKIYRGEPRDFFKVISKNKTNMSEVTMKLIKCELFNDNALYRIYLKDSNNFYTVFEVYIGDRPMFVQGYKEFPEMVIRIDTKLTINTFRYGEWINYLIDLYAKKVNDNDIKELKRRDKIKEEVFSKFGVIDDKAMFD